MSCSHLSERSGSYMARPVLQDKIAREKKKTASIYIRPLYEALKPLALMGSVHITSIKPSASGAPGPSPWPRLAFDA